MQNQCSDSRSTKALRTCLCDYSIALLHLFGHTCLLSYRNNDVASASIHLAETFARRLVEFLVQSYQTTQAIRQL